MVTLISPYHNGDTQATDIPPLDTPTKDTGDLNLENVVSKLIRIILRSRLGSDSYYCKENHPVSSICCVTNPIPSTAGGSGWELVLRIIHKSMVLERWIFHFNPTTSSTTATKHDKAQCNQLCSSLSVTADIILLLQSVYSHTRLLPVESLLDQLLLTKADFSFLATSTATVDASLGCHSSLTDGFQTTDFCTMNDFRPQASVATHSFSTIDCMDIQGRLSLQVIYDETIDKELFVPKPAQLPYLHRQQSQLPAPKSVPFTGPDIVVPAFKGKSAMRLTQFDDQQDVSMSTATPYQLQVLPPSSSNPPIGMRRLCRLSLSAMTGDESSAEQDQLQYDALAHQPALAIPLSTSPIQYTHHGHTLAYSTSPLPNYQQKRRLSLPYQQQHNHGLVGSYEESLLSGRMSTLQPSKPIWFHADIGVVGYGAVKPDLKCPPHRSIAFPAQYYDGQEINNNNNNSVDEPSFSSATTTTTAICSVPPYVGTIDLTVGPNGAPSKGYRIPSRGQLQIAIKIPDKSLIKLFLVPYDVSQMPRGMKTFLRQKSYSQPRSQFSSSSSSSPAPKYIIHLQICRTDKNRVYLYKKIRVAFVNRCLSSKEVLFMVYDSPKDPAYTPLSS